MAEVTPAGAQGPLPDQARRAAGWRGVVLIACTYVYFLIFAQFGFLNRLAELGIAGEHLKQVMGAMALGGITGSLLAARRPTRDAGGRLRLALAGCGAAALGPSLTLSVMGGMAVALGIGLSLGLLTVTLVANLRQFLQPSRELLQVGFGTGLGYLFCNVPALFAARPRSIAFAAAGFCAVAIASTLRSLAPATGEPEREVAPERPRGRAPAVGRLRAWFYALVWFDSAAVFIIQNSPALKSGTWQGDVHLWRNGALHLVAALGSAFLIARWGLRQTLLLAFGCLAAACLFLLHPEHAAAAAWLYPVGVSLYSVALVAYPSLLLSPASLRERTAKAGWIYAVAGWVGSALGIGMGQNLHRVPPVFIGGAALLFCAPALLPRLLQFRREAAGIAVLLALAAGVQHALPWYGREASTPGDTLVAQGRRVYIAEGCIHCHSQYVRPHSADVLLWGPAGDLQAIRRQQPPLIGNRRQGPDLSEVGSRRSALWLRMHFIEPRDVSYGSVMPSYAALFRDDRGAALLAYLGSLQTPDSGAHLRAVLGSWEPGNQSGSAEPALPGSVLFQRYCATCHMPGGAARARWQTSFRRLPPDVYAGPFHWLPAGATESERLRRLAPLIKFGLPGTDMPGHEYLPDSEIEAIARWVAQGQTAASE